jgi:alpha-tubulin suppressor-like RCC1 family protein
MRGTTLALLGLCGCYEPSLHLVDAADAPPDAPNDARPDDILGLAAGRDHTCVVFGDGRVRCWGSGADGRLGYGNVDSIGDDEPAVLAGLVDVGRPAIAITAGGAHTCALLEGGEVRCWGRNEFGQLGYGDVDGIGDNELPAAAGTVPVGGPAIAISAGESHTCAILEGGAVHCWGLGADGRLGYGNTATIGDNEPLSSVGAVPIGAKATAISAGARHTCVVTDLGALRCWGANGAGQLGYGHTSNVGDDEPPSNAGDVVLGRLATSVACGADHTCAVGEDGAVLCWGQGTLGRLGYGNENWIGDTEPPLGAGPVSTGAAALGIATGWMHTCAVLQGNVVRCWGDATVGRLGYGNTDVIGDDEPPSLAGPVDVGLPATTIHAGLQHTCVTTTDQTVRCWGAGYLGRLGYGSQSDIGDDETPSTAGDVPIE